MNTVNKLLFSVIYITLIFPYINIGLSEVGTQPVFHVAILLFFTIFSLNKTLLIIFVIFILTFLEMLFLRYFNYQINNIDIFKITALTLVIAFKHLANKFLLINSNLKNYSLIEIVPIGLFALMFILFLSFYLHIFIILIILI